MKTSLYRYFDSENRLLYVGIAKNPIKRLQQHGAKKDLTKIRHIELEWFGSRAEAKLAERTAVHRERPAWNIVLQVAKRVPRKTKLPIPAPEFKPAQLTLSVEPLPSAARRKPFARFGPPEPFYVIGLGVSQQDYMNHVLPLAFLDFEDADDGVLLRRGDVIVADPAINLPPALAWHVQRNCYLIDPANKDAIASAVELSRARRARWVLDRSEAKRTMPAGFKGLGDD